MRNAARLNCNTRSNNMRFSNETVVAEPDESYFSSHKFQDCKKCTSETHIWSLIHMMSVVSPLLLFRAHCVDHLVSSVLGQVSDSLFTFKLQRDRTVNVERPRKVCEKSRQIRTSQSFQGSFRSAACLCCGRVPHVTYCWMCCANKITNGTTAFSTAHGCHTRVPLPCSRLTFFAALKLTGLRRHRRLACTLDI